MSERGGLRDGVYAGLRVVAAWVYMQHGLQKLFGVFGGVGPGGATVNLHSLFGAAGIIECLCGLLIAIGLLTRAAAFLASGEMAVAYFMAHFPHNPVVTVLNHGEVPAILAFLFLYISLTGPGPYSLDAVIARARGVTAPAVARA